MTHFTDLNIPCTSPPDESVHQMVETAFKLGYEVIAISRFVEELVSNKKMKRKATKGESINYSIPEPYKPPLSEETQHLIQIRGRPLTTLSRVTVKYADPANAYKLKSPEVSKYDLLAVQPVNEKAWQHACTYLDVDIISVDFSEKLDFVLKEKTIRTATDRGICFEICYGPAIRDRTARINVIANARSLIRNASSKHVIISSHTSNAFDMRGPNDVTNLALLFGMTNSFAKWTITNNCKSVLSRAGARLHGRGVVQVEKMEEPSPAELPASGPTKETGVTEEEEGVPDKKRKEET